MKKIRSALIALACVLSAVSFSGFAEGDLNCPGSLSYGIYTGTFQKSINKDDYRRTHYVFKDNKTLKTACVQVAEETTPNRAKQAYNAFVLGQTVTISIGDENYLTGLAITYNQ